MPTPYGRKSEVDEDKDLEVIQVEEIEDVEDIDGRPSKINNHN